MPFAVWGITQAWVDSWVPHLPWPAHLVPTALLATVGVESARGVAVGVRQVRDTRRLASWVATLWVPPSAPVLQAAGAAGAGKVTELADRTRTPSRSGSATRTS